MILDFPCWEEHSKAAGCDWAFIAPEASQVDRLDAVEIYP
jgi:hypothetical protein